MSNTDSSTKLCKVVCFDEGSVTDFVQIIEKGEFEKTVESLQKTLDEASGKAGLTSKLGISGIFKTLLGSEVATSVEASANATYDSDHIVKTIVKNTLLTDFIKVIEKEPHGIKKFKNYTIDTPKNSLSYMALIAPYFSMISDGNIPAGEFNIAVEKLDNTLKSAKGYYEFIGTKQANEENSDCRVIFRFNIESFKNNYKVTDLLRMNLVIYAIKVGDSTIEKLDFSNEFKFPSRDNPDYEEDERTENTQGTLVSVYDVLLAGVEIDD